MGRRPSSRREGLEHVLDQTREAHGLAHELLVYTWPALGLHEIVGEHLRVHADRGERRPQLVAHGRHELALLTRESALLPRCALDHDEREHHHEHQAHEQPSLDPREPRQRRAERGRSIDADLEIGRDGRDRATDRALRGLVLAHEARSRLGDHETSDETRQPHVLDVLRIERHALQERRAPFAHRAEQDGHPVDAIEVHRRVLDLDGRRAGDVGGQHGRFRRLILFGDDGLHGTTHACSSRCGGRGREGRRRVRLHILLRLVGRLGLHRARTARHLRRRTATLPEIVTHHGIAGLREVDLLRELRAVAVELQRLHPLLLGLCWRLCCIVRLPHLRARQHTRGLGGGGLGRPRGTRSTSRRLLLGLPQGRDGARHRARRRVITRSLDVRLFGRGEEADRLVTRRQLGGLDARHQRLATRGHEQRSDPLLAARARRAVSHRMAR